MECTWKDCKKEGTKPQLDKNGNEWSNLCEEHHLELEQAIYGFVNNESPRTMFRAWVLASDGAKKMSEDIIIKCIL